MSSASLMKSEAEDQQLQSARAVESHFLRALKSARCIDDPWRHWLLEDILPSDVAQAITTLPISPALVTDTKGRRETNNGTRVHFAGRRLDLYPAARAICEAFQSRKTTDAIERSCGTSLSGTNLRIEYCQDTSGFWLEPHTDIGVKKFTMLIYLSDGPGSDDWGTDVLRDAETYVGRAPSKYNSGLIFVPSNDTWHAFRPRPITGVRRALMINFVGPEFRARHELAYPDHPIG